MRALLKAEYRKTRGRYLFLTVFGIAMAGMIWCFGGNLSEDAILKGWMMELYQMPLMSALFLPVLATVVASRLSNLEHKNGMLRKLCCIAERGKLFDAKLLYGSFLMLTGIVLTFAGLFFNGFLRGYGGFPQIKEYALLFLFTVVPTMVIYILQHTVSLCCKKAAVPFIVGVTGEFIGIMFMFLPPIPVLRQLFPWGYYGVMMFVGSDFDRATRISTYYYLNIDWVSFGIMFVIGILLYFTGKRIFYRMEL